MTPPDPLDHGGGAFNGDHYVLYWADASAELAFVVPTHKPKSQTQQQQQQLESQQLQQPNVNMNEETQMMEIDDGEMTATNLRFSSNSLRQNDETFEKIFEVLFARMEKCSSPISRRRFLLESCALRIGRRKMFVLRVQ